MFLDGYLKASSILRDVFPLCFSCSELSRFLPDIAKFNRLNGTLALKRKKDNQQCYLIANRITAVLIYLIIYYDLFFSGERIGKKIGFKNFEMISVQ